MFPLRLWFRVLILLLVPLPSWAASSPGRRVIRLNGTWRIAEGTLDQAPARFEHVVPVPGLVDMARPAFEKVGVLERDPRRQAFWYRRRFRIEGPLPAVARLVLNKAKFGTRVFLNGQLVGDHLPCFTPGVFNVRKFLQGNGRTNTLVVRVGASRMSVPRTMPDGFDFEKIRYLPGIYDSVRFVLSGSPYIERVQTVPDLKNQTVRVVATVRHTGPPIDAGLDCRVRTRTDDRVVGRGKADVVHWDDGQSRRIELVVPIADCRLWSPEDPFLYRLEVTTGADTLRTRFGMRTFRFDPATGRAVLNGKPYAMRGTNVCIYRFFEDPSRGDRPWRDPWVRRLHQVFKGMHWNSIRYCIGFPPERWYDIADEQGLLIQDEFPIWFGGEWPKELKADEIAREYTEWLRTRWNHPCVVIWDAQNESRTAETGKALRQVRGLDLSDRPWDNGYGLPDRPSDTFEAHPYPFHSRAAKRGQPKESFARIPTKFRLADFAKAPAAPGAPGLFQGSARPNEGHNPVIINEYGWLWLNRDGSPTTLTKANYDAWLGPNATAAQRRELYARYLAAMTEHWRSHRRVAAVLHFCGLAYSRPTGQTSDHFTDIETLTLEPHFATYVRDAFAPVGLMIDFWNDAIPAGDGGDLRVAVINDLATDWQGTVRLRIMQDAAVTADQDRPCKVQSLGRQVVRFGAALPTAPGAYRMMAELHLPDGQPVRSWRDVRVRQRHAGK